MEPIMVQCVETYLELSGKYKSCLKFAATPFLYEDKVFEDCAKEPEGHNGILQPTASSVPMKVLYAARLARFDCSKQSRTSLRIEQSGIKDVIGCCTA